MLTHNQMFEEASPLFFKAFVCVGLDNWVLGINLRNKWPKISKTDLYYMYIRICIRMIRIGDLRCLNANEENPIFLLGQNMIQRKI